MRHILPLALMFVLVLSQSPLRAEDEPQKGTFKVDLPSGIHYFCHVPDGYEAGKTGLLMLFHGRGGTGEEMLGAYVGGGFAAKFNWIIVAPKSPSDMWEPGMKGAEETYLDITKKYKLDPKRINVSGFSAGGLFAGWYGLSNLERLRTLVVSGACLDNGPIGAAKKKLNMPIYLINGENCQYMQAAKSNFDCLVKFGCRYARRKMWPGEGHAYNIAMDFPMLTDWYSAVESGYDYPAALDRAKKEVKQKVEKAIATVADIEKQPREDGFWAELDGIKKEIDAIGEKKLKSILTRAKTSPDKGVKELGEFAAVFAGYPVGEKAAAELEKAKGNTE
ncbi:MAG: hypothetical protein WC712_03170 [Candidatus Brocadiia bacterium]